MGALCWNSVRRPGAVFSGDPTNTKDAQGRACQLIDLDLAELRASGVRYAVWNVLAYSKVPFSQAGEVCAALQWGADAFHELFSCGRSLRAGGVYPKDGPDSCR